MAKGTRTEMATGQTIGIDVGHTWSQICVVDASGAVVEEARVRTTTRAVQCRFATLTGSRVVLEVGTHSPWLSRLLAKLGHEAIVANPGRVRLIAASDRKHDCADAERLARLGRIDPALLAPIRHRGAQAQRDLAVIRRHSLVRARTSLINHVRQAVKSQGGRLPACAAAAFTRKVGDSMPAALTPLLAPHLTVIADLSAQIAQADRAIVRLGREAYPETQLLQQVAGVGPLTALTFILTIDVRDYQQKRDYLYDVLSSAGYSVRKPEGAFYMFPESPVPDEMQLVEALQQRGVLVVPGRGFGLPGHFRISYCVPQSGLEGAAPAFAAVANELRAG